MTEQKRVTIVVPVYNEGDNIPHFTRAVMEAMTGLPYRYELLFVDDGSRAESCRVLRETERREPHVRAIFLSRNYGHQAALTCGLDHAEGDAVITMDGDMQHPPALLPRLLALWAQARQRWHRPAGSKRSPLPRSWCRKARPRPSSMAST